MLWGMLALVKEGEAAGFLIMLLLWAASVAPMHVRRVEITPDAVRFRGCVERRRVDLDPRAEG